MKGFAVIVSLLSGAASCLYGAYILHPSLAFIVGGIGLLAIGVGTVKLSKRATK